MRLIRLRVRDDLCLYELACMNSLRVHGQACTGTNVCRVSPLASVAQKGTQGWNPIIYASAVIPGIPAE